MAIMNSNSLSLLLLLLLLEWFLETRKGPVIGAYKSKTGTFTEKKDPGNQMVL